MVAKSKPKPAPIDALTTTTTHCDGVFIRTALVMAPEEGRGGSVDVVDYSGRRLAQINLFLQREDVEGKERLCLMVDVIDVERRFNTRRALVFSPTERAHLDVPSGGNLVGVHFETGGGK